MDTILSEYKSLFATIKNENNCSWHRDSLYKMVDNFIHKHRELGADGDLIDAMRDDLYSAISEIM